MKKSSIIWLDIHSLRPMELNPRHIKDENFRKLQQSIIKDIAFMEIRPILVNKNENGELYIYAGTQRWRACKDLGWENVPCIVEENIPEDVLKSRMLKDNIHAGVFDEVKLQEFDNSNLELLDISAMSKKLDFAIEPEISKTINIEGDMTIINQKGQKPADVYGFNVVFKSKEDLTEFKDIMSSMELKEGSTLEKHLLAKYRSLTQ